MYLRKDSAVTILIAWAALAFQIQVQQQSSVNFEKLGAHVHLRILITNFGATQFSDATQIAFVDALKSAKGISLQPPPDLGKKLRRQS